MWIVMTAYVLKRHENKEKKWFVSLIIYFSALLSMSCRNTHVYITLYVWVYAFFVNMSGSSSVSMKEEHLNKTGFFRKQKQ